MSFTKVFVVYSSAHPVFKNRVFEPIQTGHAVSEVNLDMLHDDMGVDNISAKNPYYGELTAWYWVLKNYLPAHPEVTHVGFCHYRRFIDFHSGPKFVGPFIQRSYSDFAEHFVLEYDPGVIEQVVSRADIVVPGAENFFKLRPCPWYLPTMYNQFQASGHVMAAFRCGLRQIARTNKGSRPVIDHFLRGMKMRICLNFIMRRELFIDLAEWMFAILKDMEKQFDWTVYQGYSTVRTPAYLAERFFNIWLALHPDLKIQDQGAFLLVDHVKSVPRRIFERTCEMGCYAVRQVWQRILKR